MPYTAAQLATIYTNTQAGVAPSQALLAVFASYAQQNAAGTLTNQQVLNAVIALANPTTAVAITTYQFFTGSAPTAAGIAYLVNSPTNPNDLNDPYYAQFNTVNRYINFSSNLGTGAGAGAASFQAQYGALSLTDTVSTAYESIIGSGNASAAGFDPAAGRAYIASQIPYFQAFARQNNPTATAAQLDLIVKAEIVGYTLEEALKANLGSYAVATGQLLVDAGNNATGFAGLTTLGTSIFTNYGSNTSGAVNLTLGTDIITGNVFNANQATSSTGDTRANTLQDEDQLTGVGTNPTLNFVFGNPGLNGGTVITPTLRNISTVNVQFSGSGTFSQGGGGLNVLTTPVLDLQDGGNTISSVNLSRISATNVTVSVVNLQTEPANLSVTDTNAPATAVVVNTVDAALTGTKDSTKLTLANAQIASFTNQSPSGTVANGVETVAIVSQGSTASATAANTVGTLTFPGIQSATITGKNDLTLGGFPVNASATTAGSGQVISSNGGALTQVEATRYQTAFLNDVGTLTLVDASAFTGNLNITFGDEPTGAAVQNSGQSVAFVFKGGTGNDTVRLTGLFAGDAVADSFDGGAGTNTLAFAPNNVGGSTFTLAPTNPATFANFQALDLRTGADQGVPAADTINVDMSQLTAITSVTIRNEGQIQNNAFGALINGAQPATQSISYSEGGTFNLTKLSATQASAINVLHGTTGNSSLGQTVVLANIATDTTADLVGVTLTTNPNADVRNALILTGNTGPLQTTAVESYKITDADQESDTVRLTNLNVASGTVTVTGGTAGTFVNLDATNTPGAVLLTANATINGNAISVAQAGITNQQGLYGLDAGTVTATSGTSNGPQQINDDLNGSTTSPVGFLATNVAFAGGAAAQTGTNFQNTSVADLSLATGVLRFAGATIDASAALSNVIVRVSDNAATGSNGAQKITLGTGNDTVVFDAINNNRAGLTISDSVDGGGGNDVLAIDGQNVSVSLGASEWTNVKNFEALRLIGNGFTPITANGIATNTALTSNLNAYNLTLTNDLITNNSNGTNLIAIINDDNAFNDGVTRFNNPANTPTLGTVSAVTIDGRTLDANHSFSYNGEEGFNPVTGQGFGSTTTADRFILTDATMNGRNVIDGGAILGALGAGSPGITGIAGQFGTSNIANSDVIEVRNSAVVTAGDLANIANIGTLEFSNDLAVQQQSFLELTSTVVDALVNNTRTSAATALEYLSLTSRNNTLVAGANTIVNTDITQIGANQRLELHGNGSFVITSSGAAQNAQVITGGFVTALNPNTEAFTGTVAFVTSPAANGQSITSVGPNGQFTILGTAGADNIVGGTANDTISAGAGADTVTGGGGADTIDVGAGDTGDTLVYTALGQTFQGIVADGTVISPAPVAGVSAGADLVTNVQATDIVNLSALLAGNPGLGTVGTVTEGVTYLNGTVGNYALVDGTYNPLTGAFTAGAAGPDILFQYDTNGVTAGGVESVVLVGSNASITNATAAATGIATFG